MAASTATAAPLDSVIVRLLKANLSVYTMPSGAFVLGVPVPVVMSETMKNRS
ncbi:MAG: hypothetical protein JW768_14845 [Chitinispirillaceae bacterium]|nr:hypothetical protein [Chitinispirillaceae bacterium]